MLVALLVLAVAVMHFRMSALRKRLDALERQLRLGTVALAPSSEGLHAAGPPYALPNAAGSRFPNPEQPGSASTPAAASPPPDPADAGPPAELPASIWTLPPFTPAATVAAAPLAPRPPVATAATGAPPAATTSAAYGTASGDGTSSLPPAPPPPRGPTAASPSINWEQFLGVRAAAIVSAIALGLAGLLFFKYSIEHGLFPPWLRVVLGTIVGIASVGGSEFALRRRYAGTANALAGGGLVVLYAAFWAASVRYELIGLTPGFVLMAAVTATGCALAWRHNAELTALLALAGGFATPLLLSSGSDRPFGLFGYLLMLDAGLVYIATKRGWPRTAMLALAGTGIYQAGWIGTRMGPDRLWLGLAVLGVFALVFAAAGRRMAEKGAEWRLTQFAAILFPFAFGVYFASDARFAAQLLPIGLLFVLLSAAAAWLSRGQRSSGLSIGAAAGGLGVLLAWSFSPSASIAFVWQIIAVAVSLALVFHVFVELESERRGWDEPAVAGVLAVIGHGAVLTVAMAGTAATVWPWIGAWTVLAVLLVRQGAFAEREQLDLVAPILFALGVTTLDSVHGGNHGVLAPVTFLMISLAAAAAYQGVAIWRGGKTPWADHGAGAMAALLLAACASTPSGTPPLAYLGTTLAFGLMMALVSARTGAGGWLLAAVAMTAAAHASFTTTSHASDNAGFALAAGAAGVLVFTAWPFAAGTRLRADRFAWYAAALAGPLWFLPLRSSFIAQFGDDAIGVLPLALGAVALAAAFRARDVVEEDCGVRTTALAWLAAVALGGVSVAIPLQLEKSWITMGWALEGVAVLYLWTRLDHVGLKYFGLALLAAATARLVTNPAVLGYYPRPEWRIFNWLMYTYLVPAAALLASASLLERFELARANKLEREVVYPHGLAVGAIGCGLAALVVIFVWLNLAIADWFATGPVLTFNLERLPARDLTTSFVWVLYALVLLGIGMARASSGLRWVSLGLLIVSIAKVFLHDLGELRDLYRVASLVGLAISLLAVSIAYQRFVFRAEPAEEKP